MYNHIERIRLVNGKFLNGPITTSLDISNGIIQDSGSNGFDKANTIDLKGKIIGPGWINSHDHLEFNVFPNLYNRIYRDYIEWGADIHKTHQTTIQHLLNIPLEIRQKWGIFKNIINGVTTVIDHGNHPIKIKSPGLRIYKKFSHIHSVSQDRYWKFKLNIPNSRVVAHVAEGFSEKMKMDADRILKWNLLKNRLIAAHGISMTPAQAIGFQALVWCPDSNMNLYGQTADVKTLRNATQILFGSDSTLSAHWDLHSQIALAVKSQLLSKTQLFESLTTTAAGIWGLATGKIENGLSADLVIREDNGLNFPENCINNERNPILAVISKGRILYFHPSMLEGNEFFQTLSKHYYPVRIKDTEGFYFEDMDLLFRNTVKYKSGFTVPFYTT